LLKQTKKMQGIGACATLRAPVGDSFRFVAARNGDVAKTSPFIFSQSDRENFLPDIFNGRALPVSDSLSYPMLGSEIVGSARYE
jgi:hypothetical protein